jgi:hypothetical protein
VKFAKMGEFGEKLQLFTAMLAHNGFSPRKYILENLTLEICARLYLNEIESLGQ